MEKFEYDGIVVDFHLCTGEVLNPHKYSETHLSSTGGGGYWNKDGGSIQIPTITTSVTTYLEFWVKQQNGTQSSFKLTDSDISLLPGQQITVVSAGSSELSERWKVMLINYDAREVSYINKGNDFVQYLKVCQQPPLEQFLFIASVASIIGAVFFFIFIHAIGEESFPNLLINVPLAAAVLLILAVSIPVFFVVESKESVRRAKRNAFIKAFDAYVENLGKQAINEFLA